MTANLDFSSMSPYAIAEHFGIHYQGDANPIDHDGLFYETDNWEEYGYASGVRFRSLDSLSRSNPEKYEGILEISCVVINRHDDIDVEHICNVYGIDPEGIDIHLEIDANYSHWGAETETDYSGYLVQIFRRIDSHCLKVTLENGETLDYESEEDLPGEFIDDSDDIVSESDIWDAILDWLEGLKA